MDGPEREREQEGARGALRLFVDAALAAHAPVSLDTSQAHYLRRVMRRAPGDRIRLFNGRDGEWSATIESLASGGAVARADARLAAQAPAPELGLLFAPLKATPTRFVIEKATELGAGLLQPVLTRRCRAGRVNVDRLRAHATEAAEQCGRLEVPQIMSPRPLDRVLSDWPPERRLLVCDPEAARPVGAALAGGGNASWSILIGPEGGFAPEERRLLAAHPAAVPARLGPRTLRAETAAAAALACWQAFAGDWR